MLLPFATISLQSIRDAVAAADGAVFRAINLGLAARWLDFVMLGVTTLGEGWVQALIGLIAVIAAAVKKRDDLRRMGYAALVAYAGSGLLSEVVKRFADRHRPVLTLFDARVVGDPLFMHSFPSGHTTTAFAAAFAWGAFMPKARWALYGIAALVAISRVYLGVHFPLDVAYGAVLGALVGTGSARLFNRRAGVSGFRLRSNSETPCDQSVFAIRRMLRVKMPPEASGGAWALLGVLSVMLFFWRLGAIPLIGFDEGCYAECSREMLASGDWIVPTCNGEPFYDKPPLAYWLQAASMRAFGVNSFGARLPSAIASLALVALTVFLGTKLFSCRAGLMAGFALATSILAAGLARMAIIDALFALTITTSLGAFVLAYLQLAPRPTYLAFWAAMGTSVMVKGPAGAVLILATVLLFLLIRRDVSAIWRTMPIAGIVLCAAIALPWYAIVNERTGGAFLQEFIFHQNLARAMGKDFAHNAPFYYYVPILLAGFFPWSVFLPAAFLTRKPESAKARMEPDVSGFGANGASGASADEGHRGEREAVHEQNPETTQIAEMARLLLVVWIGTMFVMFSIVRSKLPGYIFPIYPAAALLVAQLWSNGECLRLRRSALAAAVTACMLGAVMLIVPPYLREPIPGVTTAVIPMAAALVLGCAGAYALLVFNRPTGAFAALCAGMTAFILVTVSIGLPIAARTNAVPAMKMGREIARRNAPAFALNLSPPQPQLGFYAGRPVRVIDSASEVPSDADCLVVVQKDRLADLREPGSVEARIGPYLLLGHAD